MKTRSLPNRTAGFTLIEVVISAALMALILTSAYLCLHAAIEGQKLVEPRVDILQNARVAATLIAADLRSACPLSTNYQFLGSRRQLGEVDADNLDFATHNYTPRREHEGDYCEVSYFVDKDEETGQFNLFRRRNPRLAPDPLSGGSRRKSRKGCWVCALNITTAWIGMMIGAMKPGTRRRTRQKIIPTSRECRKQCASRCYLIRIQNPNLPLPSPRPTPSRRWCFRRSPVWNWRTRGKRPRPARREPPVTANRATGTEMETETARSREMAREEVLIKLKRERGSMLVGLLWCVALLSLLVIGVLHTARMDLLVVKNQGDRIQAHYLALAGIEKAKALLYQNAHDRSRNGKNHSGELYNDQQDFKDVALGRGLYRVMRRGRQDEGGGVIYGVSDEESRLNANAAATNELMKLDGMTQDVAAAIISWRNPGNVQIPGGAERDYYTSLQPPYLPRNAPFQTVREMLMVRGVTSDDLLGKDTRQNGFFDPGVDVSDDSRGDGEFDADQDSGWAGILTVDSQIANVNAGGQDRVNLQTADKVHPGNHSRHYAAHRPCHRDLPEPESFSKHCRSPQRDAGTEPERRARRESLKFERRPGTGNWSRPGRRRCH